eukprot:scaffold118909_cov37-Tisochrysis_lutea.AAC.1
MQQAARKAAGARSYCADMELIGRGDPAHPKAGLENPRLERSAGDEPAPARLHACDTHGAAARLDCEH